MAIDTRDKRASAIHVLMPWRGMLPSPDASFNQGDRQQVALFYRGILAVGGAAPTFLLMGLFGLASSKTTPANDELV